MTWVKHNLSLGCALTVLVSLGVGACLVDINPLFETGGETGGDGDGDSIGAEDGTTDESESGDPLVDSAPVARYRFETNDVLIDESGYANHGFAVALGLSPGVSGMAMDCATSEAVQVPDSPSLDMQEAVTMAMWVRPESFPQFGRAVWFDNSGQYGIMYDASAGYICRLLTYAGTYQVSAAAQSVSLGTWTHIACTYDGTRVRLYTGGEQVESRSATGKIATSNSEPVAIGSNSPGFDEPCSGLIDEVEIYDRALSGAQIATLAGL